MVAYEAAKVMVKYNITFELESHAKGIDPENKRANSRGTKE